MVLHLVALPLFQSTHLVDFFVQYYKSVIVLALDSSVVTDLVLRARSINHRTVSRLYYNLYLLDTRPIPNEIYREIYVFKYTYLTAR